MKHDKTFEAIAKLKDIEIEIRRLKTVLEITNKALDASVLAEREACAKSCEELLSTVNTGDEHGDGVGDCIDAIRARGDHNMHQKSRSYDDDTQYDEAQVQAMIDKAVRDEREACARVCQELKPFGPHLYIQKATAEDCAAAIRART